MSSSLQKSANESYNNSSGVLQKALDAEKSHEKKENLFQSFDGLEGDDENDNDGFWSNLGDDDDVVDKIRISKRQQERSVHSTVHFNNSEKSETWLPDLEKMVAESIDSAYTTICEIVEEMFVGAGNNNYNYDNRSKSIANDPSLVLATNASRSSDSVKAAILLRKLKEIQQLENSTSSTTETSSDNSERRSLPKKCSTACSQKQESSQLNIISDHKVTCNEKSKAYYRHSKAVHKERPACGIQERKRAVKGIVAAVAKTVVCPIKEGVDAIRFDIEKQRSSLMHYQPLEHDDDECSVEDLRKLFDFRETDLEYLQNTMRKASLCSSGSATSKRLRNDKEACLVDLTPNLAMFVLPAGRKI